MMRVALGALLFGLAEADLAAECMKGLELLDGDSDMELAVRCRAAFGPEVCKRARRSLGPQPWTHVRMKSSCAHFASTYEGMDDRSLEEAVSNKVPTQAVPADRVLQNKAADAAVVAASVRPEGPVANLLDKLQQPKEAEESPGNNPEAKRETPRSGEAEEAALEAEPEVAELRKALDTAGHSEGSQAEVEVDDSQRRSSNVPPAQGVTEGAGLRKALGTAGGSEGSQAKVADEVAEEVEAGVSQHKSLHTPPARVAAEVAEAREATDAADDSEGSQLKSVEEAKKASEASASKEANTGPAVKLYEAVKVESPGDSANAPSVLGPLAGAVCLAAITLLVASARRRPAHHSRLQMDPEQVVE